MRAKKYIIFLFILSVTVNLLYAYIQENTILINDIDLSLSNEELLAMQIELPAEELKEYAGECHLPLGEYMTVLMVKNHFQITEEAVKNTSCHDIIKWRNRLMRSIPEDFKNLSNYLAALETDLQYFPIPISKLDFPWVEYCNSWGGERTYGGERTHEGTDIMALQNTAGIYPVLSACSGTITNLGWLELGGWRIGITSENGIYYYYAHLDSYADIKIGDTVKPGDLLGFMGNSGYSKVEGTKGKFDVHLHFGIYLIDSNGTEIAINPYYLLKTIENKILYYQYGI